MRTRRWLGASPPGWKEGATKLGYAKEILGENGICSLEACPYVADLEPLEGPKPDEAAEKEASNNRFPDSDYFDFGDLARRPPGIAQKVYDLLAEGRPVAVSFPVFYLSPGSSLTTLDNPRTDASGEVIKPPLGSAVQSTLTGANTPGHAVCIVGFQPDPLDTAGGWFIFRNSFGSDWADSIDPGKSTPPHVPARGYGAIPASYVENYCWEIFSPKSS
jgi:hypothetical protein